MTRGSKEWRLEQAKLQQELNECLSELAELGLGLDSGVDPAEREHERQLRDIAIRLNRVYSNEGFRHRYSEIVEVIHRDDRDKTLSTEGRLDKANERGAFFAVITQGTAYSRVRRRLWRRMSRQRAKGKDWVREAL